MNKPVVKSILLVALALTSCDVFSTRTPENPTIGIGTYEPPTSADIVLANFVNAINEANISNYEKCFADKSKGHAFGLVFEPSGSVLNSYTGIFADWTTSIEVRTMKSVFTSLQTESKPVFVMSNQSYNSVGIDSVSLSADYSLSVSFVNEIEQRHYSGSMYLYLYKEADGYWYINRWIDLDSKTDTTHSSFSLLKAEHYN